MSYCHWSSDDFRCDVSAQERVVVAGHQLDREHGPDERCLDCATDDEVLDAVPPWPGTPASTDGGEG